MDSTVTADASTVTLDQYGNQVDQYGNKINKWVKQREGGARHHQAGDNQCHVGYSFPSWQRDSPGTDLLLGEEWDGNEQYWRCWEFFSCVVAQLLRNGNRGPRRQGQW